MKTVLNATARDNQTNSEISMHVSRGHASVQLIIDTYQTTGAPSSVDIYLQPEDAAKLVTALGNAAREVQSKSTIE